MDVSAIAGTTNAAAATTLRGRASARLLTACAAALAATLCASAARSEAYLLMEADTGKVLQAENAAYPWYPASVTKLMTAYVILKAVKDGRLTLNTMLTVSPNAVAQAPTKMGFGTGTQVTVDNALKMLMVKSANDMAVVLAEGLDGSIEGFADEMNRTAARLGMVQTNYVNPNGLPADGHVSSARDLGILARAIYRDLPEYDYFWHLPGIKFGRRVIRNYNSLLSKYQGADGMKTGFICASGFNLVASATRNGRHLIAVVLGSPSSAVRTYKAAQLFESGFNQNGLNWLKPSLGLVEELTPINSDPPNLRDEMCGPRRKRPNAPMSDDDNAAAASSEGGGNQLSFFFSHGGGSGPRAPVLAEGSNDLGPPVEVFIGSARSQPVLASTTASPAAKPAVLNPKPARANVNAALGLRPAAVAAPVPAAKPAAKRIAAKPATPAAKPEAGAKPAAKPLQHAATPRASGDKPAKPAASAKPPAKPAEQ